MPRSALAKPAMNVTAICARGMALHEAGRPEDALAAFTAAVALVPDDARARSYRGFMLLLLGRWDESWRDYAWRVRLGGRLLPGPLWDGSPLAGRTILLEAEQGLGDTLMMLRYVPLVAAAGGQVALAVPATFHRLLRGFPGIARIYGPGDYLEYEVHLPLFDLPRLFGTTPWTVPPPVSPLAPAPETEAARRIAAAPERKFGLVWAGNPAHPNDQRRSAPLAALRPIVDAAGWRCFSLQQGAAREQASGDDRIVDLGTFADLAETAAAIAALDLVITVDTGVAHLAGTMGKRCFLMLPFAGDWRWLTDRRDTPWYPSVTLFRQERPGDWHGLAHRLASALM